MENGRSCPFGRNPLSLSLVSEDGAVDGSILDAENRPITCIAFYIYIYMYKMYVSEGGEIRDSTGFHILRFKEQSSGPD